MSRAGTPTDNPQAESFMKALKSEDIYQFGYENISDVKNRFTRLLNDVFNKQQIHSALQNLTPKEYENRHAASRSKSKE